MIRSYVHDAGYMLLIDIRAQDRYIASHILVAKQWKIIQNSVKYILTPSGFLEEFTFVIIYDESSKYGDVSQGTVSYLLIVFYIVYL